VPSVDNLMEGKLCVFYEISDMVILVPIIC
jgi:hypothetical protein